jgi:hypothetical protein
VTKRCPDCDRVLDQSAFGTNKAARDGLSHYCRKCTRARNTAYYARRRQAAGKRYEPRVLHPEGHKRCAECREVKRVDEFHRAKSQAGGYSPYCKPCRARRESDARFLREYGLSREALRELIESQGGVCAVCRERPAEHVDHDHVFGQVRGVLCFSCNAALGQFRDRVDLLQAAIDYLETTTWQRSLEAPGVYRLTSPRPAVRPSSSSSALQRLISSRHG